jgi:hypothetical protein
LKNHHDAFYDCRAHFNRGARDSSIGVWVAHLRFMPYAWADEI